MPNPQQLITTTTKDGGSVDNAGAIIDHLNIWTAAIKKRGSQGRGSSKKIELHGIKKLRELILELAVRGLLVPQNPNDEPASVLLEKIAAEKERLLKDKKIKKQKPLPEISEDEKPFELPKGWEWERLGDLSYIFAGNSFKSGDFNESGGTRVIKITNAGVGELIETEEYLPENFSVEYKNYRVEEGDLVMALTRPYISSGLKVSACPSSYHHALLNQRVAAIRVFSDRHFLYLFMQSDFVLGLYRNRFGGSGLQPNLKMNDLTDLVMPIPPEAEQPRIVAKVDELMALCDQLEQQTEDSLTAHQTLVETLLKSLLDAAQTTPGHASSAKPIQQNQNENQKDKTKSDPFQQAWLMIWENFDALFTTEHSIDQLKQTILQLAVMGKLVPQNENDEPASVLLEKIAAEKAQLIKDGKIKKQKPLPEITDEEKPFKLPKGWEWVRMGDLAEYQKGYAFKSKDYLDKGVMITKIQNLTENSNQSSVYIAPEKSSGFEQYILKERDIVMTTVGSWFSAPDSAVGRSFLINKIFEGSLLNQNAVRIRFWRELSSMYLFTCLNSSNFKKYLINEAQGTANQASITQASIKSYTLSIPPEAEQPRIVAKVDELMALCDTLKERIRESQTTQLHLADAMAEQTLNE